MGEKRVSGCCCLVGGCFCSGGGQGGPHGGPLPSWSPWMPPCCSRSPTSTRWPPWRRSSRSRVRPWGAPGGPRGGGEHRGAALTLGGGGTWRGAMGDRKQGGGMTTHRGPQGCPWSHWVVPGGPYPLGGVFAHWGGSWSYSGHGGPRLCPHMCPLGCPRMGVLGVLGSVLPMGGSPQVCPQHWKVLPPPHQSCPCIWWSQQWGGAQVGPMGISGVLRTALPTEVPLLLAPPVVPPHMGDGRPLVCSWSGGLGWGWGGGSSGLSF